jgi:hypothetical protein
MLEKTARRAGREGGAMRRRCASEKFGSIFLSHHVNF